MGHGAHNPKKSTYSHYKSNSWYQCPSWWTSEFIVIWVTSKSMGWGYWQGAEVTPKQLKPCCSLCLLQAAPESRHLFLFIIFGRLSPATVYSHLDSWWGPSRTFHDFVLQDMWPLFNSCLLPEFLDVPGAPVPSWRKCPKSLVLLGKNCRCRRVQCSKSGLFLITADFHPRFLCLSHWGSFLFFYRATSHIGLKTPP